MLVLSFYHMGPWGLNLSCQVWQQTYLCLLSHLVILQSSRFMLRGEEGWVFESGQVVCEAYALLGRQEDGGVSEAVSPREHLTGVSLVAPRTTSGRLGGSRRWRPQPG